MKNFVSQNDIAYALKVKACREEVAMTNEELIRTFFMGLASGAEESYGLSIKPSTIGVTLSPTGHPAKIKRGNLALYSKTNQFPMATKVSENYFIIVPQETKGLTENGFIANSGFGNHRTLAAMVAKQLGVSLVFSPQADKANFHRYMEEKINKSLSILANDLRTGSYISILRYTDVDFPKPIFSNTNEPELCIAVPENYQKLMENINALLEGERVLGLPKNQVALLDTDEVQSLWWWLIKESPIKEERELLREIYMLSRLLGSPRREEEDRKGGLITIPNPWNKIG